MRIFKSHPLLSSNSIPLAVVIGIFFKDTMMKYYGSYKTWLATLLGKKNISNFTSVIFIFLFALLALIVLILFFLLLLKLLSLFCKPIYCMDIFTEGRLDLLSKIAQVKDKILYFSEQVKETDYLFKEALRENLPEYMKQERLVAKRETEVNLNVSRKILKILESRLDSEDYNSSLATSSSLGKRKGD